MKAPSDNPNPSPLDRSQPPEPAPRRRFRFPDFVSTGLDNGLRVIVLPAPNFPIATSQILLPAGSETNPPELPGLADVHGGLLDQGTSHRTAHELAEDIEALGGSISSGAGWNMAWAETDYLSANLDAGLEMLAEIVLDPSFPTSRFSWLVGQNRADLLRRQSSPAGLAEDLFASLAYAGTPYAYPTRGNLDSLSQIELDHVLDFYRTRVRPRGSMLLAVGDVDPDTFVKRAQDLFGAWQADSSSPDTAGATESRIEPPEFGKRTCHIVDRPGSSQTQLFLGHPGPPRSHPDFTALMLLNMVLGGKFTSRLNLNLRERHGFTYGVNTLFVRRRGPGPFYVKAAISTPDIGAAVREILFELERVVHEPIGAEELQESVDYILGVFPYTLQSVSGLMRRLENLAVFNLPDNHFDLLHAELLELDGETILAAAQRHLHPDRLSVIAVGPAAELQPQLEPYGEVRLHPARG